MDKTLITSGSPFEKQIGFSRAVKFDRWILVSGTAPINDDGSSACVGDVLGQTKRCLQIIDQVLVKAGCDLEHVVRTRVYLRNMKRWEEAAAAHVKYFGAIRPACTFVEVSGFIRPEWLVEIEADAFTG